MGEIDDSLGVDIDAVFDFGMEINVGVVAAKEFDDGEKGERRVLVHGSARLGGVELARGRGDHLGEGGFDVHDVTYDSALDQGDKMVESRAERCLAGFEEDEFVALREVVELAGLGAREDKRDLAENMLAGLEGTFRIFVVSGVRGGDVYRVDAFYEVVERGIGPQAELAGKGIGSGRIGIQDRDDLSSADNLRLGNEAARDAAGADYADAIGILHLLTKLSTRDAFRTRKIDYFTVLIQVVELPYPVRADGEDIDIVLLNIINLLAHIVLDDDFVSISRRLHGLNAFQDIVPGVEFPTSLVERVTRNPDNQVITQLFRPPQQVDMPLMQQVICSVSDDFYHG